MRQAPLGRIAILAATLLGACSGDGLADQRPWAVASGDASVDVRLERVSDPGLHLGAIGGGGVVFGRNDFVYVNDYRRPDVLVLDSLLAQTATIGGEGKGPGEFLSKTRLQIVSGDSLLVFDSQLKRLTIFSEARLDSARVISVPPFVDDLWRLPGPERRHLVMDRPAFYAGGSGGSDHERFIVLSLLDQSAQEVVADGIISVPAPASLLVRSGGSLSVSGHPYAYFNFVEMWPSGGFLHLNNRSLAIAFFDNDGKPTGSFSYPTIPIPVAPEHLADRLKNQKNPAKARLLREGAPYTWPAVSDMIVDEDGRTWVGIREQSGETHREWAAFTRDGRHVASMRLPTNLWPRAIRGHKLLAVARDELDVPEIRLYRILWKDAQ